RRHRRAMNPVAPRARSHVNHWIAHARRLGVEHVLLLTHAERERVHKRIAVVARLEDALAAHGRHAETVAVMRDPRDYARKYAAIARAGRRIGEPSEAQRVHHRDRPRAHGEDVAQNSADARGRALKRLDEARVIVRFDLERDHVPAADIDDAGILARSLHYEL